MEVVESVAARAHNKNDNKQNKDKNECGGIMGKYKQVAICAPSCSAVQPGGQDKTMDQCGRSLC